MNTVNNPLILREEYVNRDDGSGDSYYTSNKDIRDGDIKHLVDKALAEEMLEALEDYRDFLITGVSGVSSEEICALIVKMKGL